MEKETKGPEDLSSWTLSELRAAVADIVVSCRPATRVDLELARRQVRHERSGGTSSSVSSWAQGWLWSAQARAERLPRTRPYLSNWARTYECEPRAILRARSIEDVRRVIALAQRERRTVRAAGVGHSPSDLGCTDDYVLLIEPLSKVLSVDPERLVAHVEAGMTLKQFHAAMREHDLAIPSLGSISYQTLAGAIATSTHGSGVTFGSISTQVESLTLVLADDDVTVTTVSRENDPELFLASLCGLGLTGVIVDVALRCERTFKLEEELTTITFDDFVARMPEIAESAQHTRCFWFPQVDEVIISRLNRTDKPVSPPGSWWQHVIFDVGIGVWFHKIALAVSRFFPSVLPYHANLMYALVHRPAPVKTSTWWRSPFTVPLLANCKSRGQDIAPGSDSPTLESLPSSDELDEPAKRAPLPFLTAPTTRVDDSVAVFNYDVDTFRQYTYEAMVPYARTRECLVALRHWFATELANPNGMRSHFPLEVRWTEQDDIWLSPTYGTRGTYIGIVQYKPFDLPVPYKQIFHTFEQVLAAHEGRPHWAKAHHFSLSQLHQVYPRLGDFLRVRAQQADRHDTLVNAYARRHLLGHVGEDVDMSRFLVERDR